LDVALTRRRIIGGLGGGLAFLALAMLEPQYTYLTTGLVAVHVGMRLVLGRSLRVAWASLVVFGLFAAAAVGWVLMLRNAFVQGSIADVGRGIGEVRLFAPGAIALASPATYGGFALAALTLVGLIARTPLVDSVLRALYGAVLGVGLLLTVGPT